MIQLQILIKLNAEEIVGKMALLSGFADEVSQKNAWKEQIRILKNILPNTEGAIYFEFSIPRMGQRIDVILLIRSVIFILEFKVGEKEFPTYMQLIKFGIMHSI